MNQVPQAMSSGHDFSPSFSMVFIWMSVFAGMFYPGLLGSHVPLSNPSRRKITWKSWSSLWLNKLATDSQPAANHRDQRSDAPVHYAMPVMETKGIWILIGQLAAHVNSWAGEWTPTELHDRGEEGYPQKETWVLLPTARMGSGDKCKAAHLLFISYITL